MTSAATSSLFGGTAIPASPHTFRIGAIPRFLLCADLGDAVNGELKAGRIYARMGLHEPDPVAKIRVRDCNP